MINFQYAHGPNNCRPTRVRMIANRSEREVQFLIAAATNLKSI